MTDALTGFARGLATLARSWKNRRSTLGFVSWLAVALTRRLAKHARAASRRWWPSRRPMMPLCVAALGPKSRRVFQGTRGVTHRLGDGHVDVVISDDRVPGSKENDAPCISLAVAPSISVPAFHPGNYNPIDWRREVGDRAPAALGSPRLLPGVSRARRVGNFIGRSRLRKCHHLEDTAAFHRDVVERAGTLARLAATGLPIRLVDADPELAELMGAELFDLLTADIRWADVVERESHSIRSRRVALRDHSFGARLRQVCAQARIRGPELPFVTVLLATRRPQLLSWALDNVAKQSYPRLQLALALHGDGFDDHETEKALSELSLAIRVTRVPEHLSYGAVLAAATSVATGSLLTTLDDDDLYGPDHIWDLVLAREYAGAELVGKAPETVYLARSNQTVRRQLGSGESYGATVAGPTLLIGREDLDRAGGWQSVRFADRALQQDVVRSGGRVYRTHGAGFILIRHGDKHTWGVEEDYFLKSATSIHAGWQPQLADIERVPRPPHCCVANSN